MTIAQLSDHLLASSSSPVMTFCQRQIPSRLLWFLGEALVLDPLMAVRGEGLAVVPSAMVVAGHYML